ncbi:hypothetical protein [Paenibacillus sp. IHBB 3054]|uniref:hypothetical protein n=1 Tax=Paenibacillus sp. IHBB 3054 TaxID=3425689 RepID=UPI003F668FA1
MPNRFMDLPGQEPISETYDRIESGFDNVEAEMDAAAAVSEGIQSQVTAHKDSTAAHTAVHITYSGAVAGAANIQEAVDFVDDRLDTIIVGGSEEKDPELTDIKTSDPSYTPSRPITVAGDMVRDMQQTFSTQLADTTQLLDTKADKETQRSPIQYYGYSQIIADFPGEEGYSLTGDIAFADDREGPTGKLWAFYFNSYIGIVRSHVPFVGCRATDFGAPSVVNIGGRVNHFVHIDGFWYVGSAGSIYKFNDGIDHDPTLIATLSAAGQHGDQVFVANLCVDKDDTTGTWHAWYATYNGSASGIRHATALSPSGPWTIEAGFWMVPTDIDSSLNWHRIYYVMRDKWGRLWSVAGAGDKWGGSAEPDADDGASVWVSPVGSLSAKPTLWQCLVRPPYFEQVPLGCPFFNNAYAPAFLQDGDDWYLFVNTGEYGHERIVELRPNMSASWNSTYADAPDVHLSSIMQPIERTKAFVRGGVFKVTYDGALLNLSATAQWHSIRIRISNVKTGEVLKEIYLQNGASAYESRYFSLPYILTVQDSLQLQLSAQYEVGAGQVTPSDSRIRGVSLLVEKLS